MSKKAILEINGQKYEFPTFVGSENEVAIDISSLRSATGGITTIDPGFKNTGSCASDITFLDGEKGILRYRGYSIEELADKADFLEVAYLLIFGELPTKEALDKFLGTNKNLNPEVKSALRLLFPSTIKRKNNFNKGGLIDYRKTGMFK